MFFARGLGFDIFFLENVKIPTLYPTPHTRAWHWQAHYVWQLFVAIKKMVRLTGTAEMEANTTIKAIYC